MAFLADALYFPLLEEGLGIGLYIGNLLFKRKRPRRPPGPLGLYGPLWCRCERATDSLYVNIKHTLPATVVKKLGFLAFYASQ